MLLFFYILVLPALLLVYVMGVRKVLPPLRQTVCDTVVILITCALMAVALIPPEEKIKLGRDLRGGVSLIYSVNIPEGSDKQETLTQTIKVLKQRVNPQGVLDLSILPQGDDRLEVVMPLPGETVRAAQKAYRDKLDALVKVAHLTPRELDIALLEDRAIEFGGNDTARRESLAALQAAYNKAREARRQFEAAPGFNLPPERIDELAAATAEAEVAYEQLRAQMRTGALSHGRLNRTLALSTQPGRGGAVAERERELARLKADFAAHASALDDLVATFDAYSAQRTTLDDPEDLKRLLRGAGVLDFRIAVTPATGAGLNVAELRQQLLEGGPNAAESANTRWFKINDINQWASNPLDIERANADPAGYFAGTRNLVAGKGPDDSLYLLLWTDAARSMTHESGSQPWSMTNVRRSNDELGRTAVAFELDANGGALMGRMTGAAIGQPMAIVLDNQVYTAPNLESRINDRGQITGSFSPQEIDYLTRVLASGSLGARLSPEPISVSVLGPAMGKDNLHRGLQSIMISLGITVLVMMFYYFIPGVIANISLLVNGLIIFFAMSLVDASFTLPGLAGTALSLAIAVDANVLIYERLREELVDKGAKLLVGIETAMSRAATAIIDGNITNLIVVVVLYWFAGAEVKGFALVMGIGVFSTLAAGLIVTHVLLRTYALSTKATTISMLPIAVPALARALRPNIDWLRFRFVFWGGSIAVALICIVAVFVRGGDIFETEFRGGTSMTMSTRMANPGEPAGEGGRLLIARPQIEETLRDIGIKNPTHPVLSEFRNVSVLTVGEQNAQFQASTFQIKLPNPTGMDDEMQVAQTAVAAVVDAFKGEMDIRRPVSFKGAGSRSSMGHVFRVDRPNLGDILQRPSLDVMLDEMMGGVVVVIEDIVPPITPADAAERIRRLRSQPDFGEIGGRTVEVIGIQPAADGTFSSVAVVAAEPEVTGRISDTAWQKNFADREWHLVSSALSQQASLEQVSSISPAVARDMATQAALAVIVSFIGMLIYIWVRFGSLLYSVSTIIGVLFNVSVCLGALALSKFIAGTALGPVLMMHDFRIDLNVVAALLIVIGYSLNDTIVILDRVRENRGKLPYATRPIINDSINQTFSRTILTGGCTAATPIVLYILGGPMMQPFAYTFLIGLIAGTFSSVAISAPLVFVPGDGSPEPAGGPGSDATHGRTAPAV